MGPCVFSLLLASALVAACATLTREGRVQLVAPVEVSRVYSELDMQVKLVAVRDAGTYAPETAACLRPGCDAPREFERKVLDTGQRLARSAYGLFPELRTRVPRFAFGVAWKAEAGTLSNADGAIVVLDGVRRLGLSDAALVFIIAREMGHVIGRHHDEDSATGILASAVAGLLVPVVELFRGVLAAAPSGAVLSATATAASWAGSSLVRASYRADQVREAEEIALRLVADAGTELHDVAAALAPGAARFGNDKWSQDLDASARRLAQLAWGPPRSLRGGSGGVVAEGPRPAEPARSGRPAIGRTP